MLQSVLRFTTPRRLGIDLFERGRADQATLAEARESGYHLAFISCVPAAGLDGAPGGTAAMLRDDGEGWHPIEVWLYPRAALKRRWNDTLSWEALCRAR
jgi:hypothetical protein